MVFLHYKQYLFAGKKSFWGVLVLWGEWLITKRQNNTSVILFEWNAVKSYTPNSLLLKDILRCGADDLCRPQNSQTQSQLVRYSHNTSLFVFSWPAAEHRLCPPLGAATTEMDVKACMSLMHHNNEHSTQCAELSNWPSISQGEEVNKHMMASSPKTLLKWIWKLRTIMTEYRHFTTTAWTDHDGSQISCLKCISWSSSIRKQSNQTTTTLIALINLLLLDIFLQYKYFHNLFFIE